MPVLNLNQKCHYISVFIYFSATGLVNSLMQELFFVLLMDKILVNLADCYQQELLIHQDDACFILQYDERAPQP